MVAHLAAVAIGRDIRDTNKGGDAAGASKGAAEDGLFNTRTSRKNRDSSRERHIGNRRDAYMAAVRDNFLRGGSGNGDEAIGGLGGGDYSASFTGGSSGYNHHTYHGATPRQRPTVNFDVPLRFTETADASQMAPLPQMTFADNSRITPSAESAGSATTPSAYSAHSGSTHTPSGTSYSGASSLSPYHPASDEYYNDMALISLSPSQDKEFITVQRQLSDTSSSAFETPSTTPKTTPSRFGDAINHNTSSSASAVRFEEDMNYSPSSIRSPSVKFDESVRFGDEESGHTHHHQHHQSSASPHYSNTRQSPLSTNSSNSATTPHSHGGTSSGTESAGEGSDTPTPLRPPPSRRTASVERGVSASTQPATAERPVTLDIIPRPRPAGILKRTSPAHSGGGGVTQYHHGSPRSGGRTAATATPDSSSMSTGDDSFVSISTTAAHARTHSSPGSTPPGVTGSSTSQGGGGGEKSVTLLDIDVEGQRDDHTRPLSTLIKDDKTHPHSRQIEQRILLH